ncbi:MAG: DUF2490 domain-containing protein [Brumimicrobium sp.]
MKFVLLFVLVFFTSVLLGQNQRFFSGLFPEMGINIPLNDKFKYTAKIESQNGFFSNDEYKESTWQYFHNQTDLQSFIDIQLTYRIKSAIGYQYRLEEGGNSHRGIQQITWLNNFTKFRLGSRLRADQKFSSTINPEFRLRYRAASDLPLQGSKLDDGEKYLLLSNEVIFALQSHSLTIENRLVTGLGHYFNKSKKIELSVDYRTDPYFPSVNRHRLWIKFSFYWNMKGFK